MISAIKMVDGYKTGHIYMNPKGTEKVYSNMTARISRMKGVEEVMTFGVQYFVQDFLLRRFTEGFFKRPKVEVVQDYAKSMDEYLGPGAVTTAHMEALHDLGYLPIHLKALPEGTLCPLRVPMLTITNTHPNFSWLTNYLETILSNVTWYPTTVATIAFQFRKTLEKYARETSDIPELVKWQGHDFSMRGQTSFESALVCGGAHLTCFTGSDTIPAIDWLKHHYSAEGLIAGSVPATEHSVQCLGGKETEFDTYKRLITKCYPKGIVSIVSDTWDYFGCLDKIIRTLKPEIVARDGKVVIRPDSGNPEDIICGDRNAPEGSLQWLGTARILWDIFGGTVNSKGFKQLDPHIGMIYGDSITHERCEAICARLKEQGFASTNMVYGIGSFSYQYVTRDTFGFAVKATYGVIDGKPLEMFKDPLTDGGVKKSAKGLLRVNADLTLSECVTTEQEEDGILQTVFKDGLQHNEQTLTQIRARVDSHFA